MVWQIKFSEAAESQLEESGAADAKRIFKQLRRLAELPEPRQLLSAMKYEAAGLYKYRIGNFRIILQPDDESQTLFIIMIGHRKSVYKDFKRKGH